MDAAEFDLSDFFDSFEEDVMTGERSQMMLIFFKATFVYVHTLLSKNCELCRFFYPGLTLNKMSQSQFVHKEHRRNVFWCHIQRSSESPVPHTLPRELNHKCSSCSVKQ